MNLATKLKIIILMTTTVLMLNGCSTMLLFDKSKTTMYKVGKQENLVLTDKIVAVGFPRQPLKGYENAIVFAGETNSYIAKPERINETQNIFQKMFKKVDMKHLYINTQKHKPEQPINIVKIFQVKENTLKLRQGGTGSKYNRQDFNNSSHYIRVEYIKAKNQLNNGEQQNLESMDFSCSFQTYQETEYLTCSRVVGVELAVAPKVKNFDTMEHKFKQPLKLEVYQSDNLYKANHSKQLLKVFTPVTVAFDIVTSPIQIAGFALLSHALKGIGTAF